tara:strand:+ start:1414 stop:2679 length:1266 start_codon:yes stop_codon:yes gene_type:complete
VRYKLKGIQKTTAGKTIARCASLAALIATLCSTQPSFAEETIADTISAGDTKLNFRLRYENVKQGAPTNSDGDALTLRSRFTYTTGSISGFSAQFEADNVSAFDNDSYNSTINGATMNSVIADPKGTEINQVWLQYQNWNTKFKYGRQRILLDNQRFVGGVGFRQNEQTYDGFSITNSTLKDTALFYARINNVNRIFGGNSAVGDHDSKTDLANAKYTGWEAGSITAYAYLIDNRDFARFSTDTYGVRFSGQQKSDALAFGYNLEYATQQESSNNTLAYSANYFLIEGSLGISGVKLALGVEQLGSDHGVASFITPLATLHKFQGWSDQFLATPPEGVTDLYFTIGGKLGGAKLLLVLHDFKSYVDNVAGQDDLGNEVGFVAATKIGLYDLSLKYTDYSSGDSSYAKVDTKKLWLTATANF